jgi:hypothetical protein
MIASRLRRGLRELALVAALFLAYKVGRIAVSGRVSSAQHNAGSVWRLERWLHLPSEAALQHPLLHHHLLAHLANGYYAYVHFPATALCLLYLYVRQPAHYRWVRWMIALLTAAALAVHVLLPLAPPRLSAITGMVDTGHRFGPAVYGNPSTDTLSNQYAAMPSLHIGWALAVAVGLIAVMRSRWRWLWLAHPIATTLVVVSTGNHYWLDGIVAVTILALVALILHKPAPPRPAAVPAPRSGAAAETLTELSATRSP